MFSYRFGLTAAVCAAVLLSACDDSPPQPKIQLGATEVRPSDATANLPSDTGSQTTLQSGAVTGAGQPQGTTMQPDVGEPGGLERQARREERASAAAVRGEGAPSAGAAAREATGPESPRSPQLPRQSRG
jgi:hypothetical protein